MNQETPNLKREERAMFALRSLYQKYGYTQYKMSKFEEYDLYAHNKDFLISDNIITFTDLGGRLMALKPDVTLSIVKNSKDEDGCVQKLSYSENVYRVSGDSFREIMQVGLECIGDVDTYDICETLQLAVESLRLLSPAYVLDISSLDLISAVLSECHLGQREEEKLLHCVTEKNLHEMDAVCASAGVDAETVSALHRLVTIGGPLTSALGELDAWAQKMPSIAGAAAALHFCADFLSAAGLCDERIRLDFSVTANRTYYNGITFRGFLEGVASSVLSGGQYDGLLTRMGRHSRAIGFATYLDLLEQLQDETVSAYDVDTVLLYDGNTSPADLRRTVAELAAEGHTVTAQKAVPSKIRYRQVLALKNGKTEVVENHA